LACLSRAVQSCRAQPAVGMARHGSLYRRRARAGSPSERADEAKFGPARPSIKHGIGSLVERVGADCSASRVQVDLFLRPSRVASLPDPRSPGFKALHAGRLRRVFHRRRSDPSRELLDPGRVQTASMNLPISLRADGLGFSRKHGVSQIPRRCSPTNHEQQVELQPLHQLARSGSNRKGL